MPPKQQPNYEFLNTKTPSKSRFTLPSSFDHLSGISILGILALIVIVLLLVLLGGSSSPYKNEVDIIARGQEIVRVSTLATQDAQDQSLKDLAATVSANITSQQTQLVSYLASHKKKVDSTHEVSYKNSSTDTQLAAAAQAGNIDQVYTNYIEIHLGAYQNALKLAYKTAKPSEKMVLNSAYNANNTILTSL